MRCLELKPDEAKQIIRELVGDQILFEGHFDKVFSSIRPNLQKSLLEWVKNANEGKSRKPELSTVNPNILVFFFKPNVTNVRGILTKEKNKFFLALFLDKHKYYDRERRRLGL